MLTVTYQWEASTLACHVVLEIWQQIVTNRRIHQIVDTGAQMECDPVTCNGNTNPVYSCIPYKNSTDPHRLALLLICYQAS